MTSKARLSFTLDNFPFDRLRVGTMANRTAKKSDYGTVHQQTFVEENGENMNYEIEIPEFHSSSISYWLDKDGKNLLNPDFYLNPELHHEYSKLDEKGDPKKSPNGLAYETFELKFKAALGREIRKLSDTERGQIMGASFMQLGKDTQLIFDIATHPKNDKELPDKTKSKTIPMALWTQDETKRNLNNTQNNKRKYAHLKPSSSMLNNTTTTSTTTINDNKGSAQAGKKLKLPNGSIVTRIANEQKQQQEQQQQQQQGDDLIRVPDTNTVIYTPCYDMTTNTMQSGRYTKKQISGEEPLPKCTKYEEIKPFVASSLGHFNGSGVRSDLLVMTKVLGPSLLWKPSDGGIPAKIRFTISEIVFVECSSTRNKRGLNVERMRAIQSRREELEKTYGFGNDDNNNDDYDNDNDNNQQNGFHDENSGQCNNNGEGEGEEGGEEQNGEWMNPLEEDEEEERLRLTREIDISQRQRFASLSRRNDEYSNLG